MRSMKLFWFQHLKMSPFSITMSELQAPQHATHRVFFLRAYFMRFAVRVTALHTTPQPCPKTHMLVRSSLSTQRFRP